MRLQTLLISIAIIPIALVLIFLGWSGISNGSVLIKGLHYLDKEERPFAFWLNVGAYLLVGLAALGYAFYILFLA